MILSRQSILKIFVLALAMALALAACERPLQNIATEAYPPPPVDGEATPVGDATPIVEATPVSDATATEPLATEAAATKPAATAGAATATPDDESPRPTDEPTPASEATATQEATPTTEATVTAEATPVSEATATATGESTTGEQIHVVQAGENLYRIGLQYGVSWTVLAEYNNIANPNDLEVGQQIRIPPTGATATAAPQVTHVVQQGETLFIISQQYGVSWPDIAEANNLAPPYIIYAGQSLIIPGG